MPVHPVPDGMALIFGHMAPENWDLYPVRNINYLSQLDEKLHRVETVVRAGQYREIKYFSDPAADPATDQEVIRVRVAYSVSALGLAEHRWSHRCWFDALGNIVDEKWSYKRYDHNPKLQADEGHRRRGNMLKDLEITTLGLIAMFETGGDFVAAEALGLPYLEKYGDELDHFERTGDFAPIVAGVSTDPETWLNTYIDPPTNSVTIRMAIIGSFVHIQDVADEPWTATILAGPPS